MITITYRNGTTHTIDYETFVQAIMNSNNK